MTTVSAGGKFSIDKWTIVVPDDFSTIQEAVDNASWGGTVFVRNGTYPEMVTVNKSLSLIGEDRENTIISAPLINDSLACAAVEVQAEGVTISGFTLKNAQVGIKIDEERYKMPPYSRCKIIDNLITENAQFGIFVESGENHLVSGNTIACNGEAGIYWRSSNSMISENNITGNGGPGVIIILCGLVIINYNNISLNDEGLKFQRGGWLHVYGNNINDNQHYGVEFGEGCYGSLVTVNNIERNGIGISLLNIGLVEPTAIGSENTVCINNIVNNSQQVFVDHEWDLADLFPERSNGTDIVSWNSSARGNYWSDYLTKYPSTSEIGDSNVGTTNYVIDKNNTDYFPLIRPAKIPSAPHLISFDSPLKYVAFIVAVAPVLFVVFFGYRTREKRTRLQRAQSTVQK